MFVAGVYSRGKTALRFVSAKNFEYFYRFLARMTDNLFVYFSLFVCLSVSLFV